MTVGVARSPLPTVASRRASGGLWAGVTPESPSYKWWVAGTIMLSVFIVLMNISTVSLALPSIMTTLSMSLDEAQWVVTAYMIASAVVIPTVGWLGTPGLIALASFLVSLLLALSLGRRYGWNSAFIQRCLVIGESGPEAL